MIPDPHLALRERVIRGVLESPGHADPPLRAAAFARGAVPDDLATLVDRIHAHAYRVTDADVGRGQSTRGDDAMFEVIVSAALGAASARLAAGRRALEEA